MGSYSKERIAEVIRLYEEKPQYLRELEEKTGIWVQTLSIILTKHYREKREYNYLVPSEDLDNVFFLFSDCGETKVTVQDGYILESRRLFARHEQEFLEEKYEFKRPM